MPDTIRSLAELNVMFEDNTVEKITAQDIRDLMVSLMVYAELGSGAKSAITLGTGYQAMDFTVAGVLGRGLTVDTTNKWIQGVPVAMKVDVQLEVLFRGTNNTTFDFTVFKNPDASPSQVARLDASTRIFNAAMVGVVSVSSAIQVAVGDKLQAAVRANGASFELIRGAMRVKRIGVE